MIGGWDRRPGEPILPYTTVETMDAGWAWRIDHERRVNRGYVYSSAHLGDAAAEAEFRAKNPAVGGTRVIRFASGRCERAWVGNVVAIGNAYGFVEPLEATSLGMICTAANNLAETLIDGDRVVRDAQRGLYNRVHAEAFDAVRWFLGLHYKFNDRLDTAFWRACRAGVNVEGVAELIGYYRAMGAERPVPDGAAVAARPVRGRGVPGHAAGPRGAVPADARGDGGRAGGVGPAAGRVRRGGRGGRAGGRGDPGPPRPGVRVAPGRLRRGLTCRRTTGTLFRPAEARPPSFRP